jgi:hypothetical protein
MTRRDPLDDVAGRDPLDDLAGRDPETAARLAFGHEDDSGSFIAPPPFSLRPFDWFGWALIACVALGGAIGLWMGLS